MTIKYPNSNIYPAEWDTTSSPYTVYHNFDIEEYLDEDNNTMYNYTQEQYSTEEFLKLKSIQIIEENEILKSQINVCEGAIVEMALQLLGG